MQGGGIVSYVISQLWEVENGDADEGIYSLLPYPVVVKPPENETQLDYLKRQIEADIETRKI
jgi:hypothetical protein